MKVYGQLEQAQLEVQSSNPSTTALAYIYFNSSSDRVVARTSGGWLALATATDISTLTSSVAAAQSTADDHIADSSGAHAASAISNSASGNLSATTVQAALNELQGDIDTLNAAGSAAAHIADTTDAHDASAISVSPTGNLAADDVQEALEEIQTELDAASAHIVDSSAAHAASAISNTPSGNLAATTVQAALNELQGDIDGLTGGTGLSDHLNDTTDAHDASAISVSPSGNLAADDVQEALTELQSDIDTRATAANLLTVSGTRASPTAIVGGSGISAPTATRHLAFIEGSGGAVDVSANPQIAAGSTVGQELTLVGRSDTNTVLLEDGTGLSLNGAWMGGADSVLELFWDGSNWVEKSRR